jgi:hypothetical protein
MRKDAPVEQRTQTPSNMNSGRRLLISILGGSLSIGAHPGPKLVNARSGHCGRDIQMGDRAKKFVEID